MTFEEEKLNYKKKNKRKKKERKEKKRRTRDSNMFVSSIHTVPVLSTSSMAHLTRALVIAAVPSHLHDQVTQKGKFTREMKPLVRHSIDNIYKLHVSDQYNAFWGDQRSERDSEPCTCEIAPGYLQLTCARHPTNRSLTVYQI